MAKCVYDGKGIKPVCEHCIDTIGVGMVCTHDCIIELREVIGAKDAEIVKRNALIKELAGALEHAISNRCIEDCKNKGCKYALCVVGDWRSLVAKAREAVK